MNIYHELIAAPHGLIAGATGSGKSVFLRGVIAEALTRPCYVAAIDLKRVELAFLRPLRRLVGYADEPEQVEPLLAQLLSVMEQRYDRLLSRGSQATDEPPIYLFIDELADLLAACGGGALNRLIRIGRLGRAAEIHLIAATQAPARRNLPAALVQNIPVRLALRTTDAIESRQIIGVAGAERLPLFGSGLLRTPSAIQPIKITGIPFISAAQVAALVKKINLIDAPRKAM